MSRIVVVGGANIDRIWWLDRPLVAGGRPFYDRRESRYGGGGFNTGGVLLELGHEVVLVTTLFDDDGGRATLAMLDERGFDTSCISFADGATEETEILVDPSGERTIIGRMGGRKPPVPRLPVIDAAAVYLNARRLAPEAFDDLAGFDCVVSQFPPWPGEMRPADTLIASRSDVSGAIDTVWSDAADRAGGRLSRLILTDGPNPVGIIDKGAQLTVPVPALGPLRDTTGAGDYFAAGYIDGIVRGLDVEAAVRRGNEVAAARLTLAS